jgi:hypothetical protein
MTIYATSWDPMVRRGSGKVRPCRWRLIMWSNFGVKGHLFCNLAQLQYINRFLKKNETNAICGEKWVALGWRNTGRLGGQACSVSGNAVASEVLSVFYSVYIGETYGMIVCWAPAKVLTLGKGEAAHACWMSALVLVAGKLRDQVG